MDCGVEWGNLNSLSYFFSPGHSTCVESFCSLVQTGNSAPIEVSVISFPTLFKNRLTSIEVSLYGF